MQQVPPAFDPRGVQALGQELLQYPSEHRLVPAQHTGTINGAAFLHFDGIMSWSDDGTIRLWERLAEDSVSSTVLSGHIGPVRGATVLPDGRILSWEDDRTVRLWSRQESGSFDDVIIGEHAAPVQQAYLLVDGRIRSFDGKEVIYWG